MFRAISKTLIAWLFVTAGALLLADDERLSDEEFAIAKLVQESQRSGRERHDAEGFMAIWADDAKIIRARTSEPDKYDFEMSRAQVEDVARLKYRSRATRDTKFEFNDVKVSISGDEATLRYRSTLKSKTGIGIADEVYRLRKTEKGWKVYENRYWPVESRVGEEITRYDETKWATLDAEVERTQEGKEMRALVVALMNAERIKEAHAAVKKLTAESKDDVACWIGRGYIALNASDAKDAEAAFNRALKIDPDAEVPDFMRESDVP